MPKDRVKELAKLADPLKEGKARRKYEGEERGVVYIGHLPFGLFEPQLKKFLSQFGKITRLKVPRSVKTGRPKGYAFVEFEVKEVAEIVAKTMDRYMMFDKVLNAKLVPDDRVHERMFANWNRRFVKIPRQKLEMERHNKSTEVPSESCLLRRLKAAKNKAQQLKQLGIQYDIDQFVPDESTAAEAAQELFERAKVKKENRKEAQRALMAEKRSQQRQRSKENKRKRQSEAAAVIDVDEAPEALTKPKKESTSNVKKEATADGHAERKKKVSRKTASDAADSTVGKKRKASGDATREADAAKASKKGKGLADKAAQKVERKKGNSSRG
ncbi:unnamed protein product [Vitrella brassicaformis CCMP3155]|uniref:RRM domain-containing protein n=2 Tax=Vitrella brassicaformis TaxID=1169539 RepID=A0A0G4EQG8_VITBC|nr:unnamed protein product [Vitrella brassicaformis CCMP3155]|eukprot:CEL99880.1 unnamed protein product [Vitrella brassicaformis CCMP3155]